MGNRRSNNDFESKICQEDILDIWNENEYWEDNIFKCFNG